MLQIGSLVFNLLVAAVAPATNDFVVESCDFGEVYAFNDVDCQIVLRNDSERAIRLFDIHADIPKDHAKLRELSVSPHSQAYLPVRINVANANGFSRHTFHLRTRDLSDRSDLKASAYGFVISALDQPQPEIDFGVVDTAAVTSPKSIYINSSNVANFHIDKILEKPSWIDANISADRHTVTAHVREDAPWGVYAQFIRLAINTPQQTEAWVSVKADVHGEIVPATNPLSMGLIRIGNNNEFRIRLTSRSGKPFSVGKIELDNIKGETKVSRCQADSVNCRLLQLIVSDRQPMGIIKGDIFVELPQQKQRLKIGLRGLLVDKDFVVKTLPSSSDAASTDTSGSAHATSDASVATDLNSVIKNVVQEANETPPPGAGPLLKWTLANGLQIHGFQIFRAEREDGPFVLQNVATIPSRAEDNASKSYVWRDTSTVSGKVYWYYIGLVYNDGHKQQLTSPQKVVAK